MPSRRPVRRLKRVACAALPAALLTAWVALTPAQAESRPRVVVLGFDGADARLVSSSGSASSPSLPPQGRGELPAPADDPRPRLLVNVRVGLDPGATGLISCTRSRQLPGLRPQQRDAADVPGARNNRPGAGGLATLALALGAGLLLRIRRGGSGSGAFSWEDLWERWSAPWPSFLPVEVLTPSAIADGPCEMADGQGCERRSSMCPPRSGRPTGHAGCFRGWASPS
jgi:hypothetical protein